MNPIGTHIVLLLSGKIRAMRNLTYALLIVFCALMLNPNSLFAETSRETPHASTNAEENLTLQAISLAASNSQPAKRTPRRLVVSILRFENRAGSQAEHWRHGIDRFLRTNLGQLEAIRLRRGTGYALRKLGIEESSSLNANQARKIGELVEAQRVIWGSYQRRDDRWQVSVSLLNVATGDLSDPLTTASADWFDIRDNLTEQLLAQLKIRPSEEEKRKLIRRGTNSPEAYEWYVKTDALQAEGKPLSEQEECARQAIAADPHYAEAYVALTSVLGSQGEFGQAEEFVRRALEIRSDYAQAHRFLGRLLVEQKKHSQAQKELQEALRLDPDDAETLSYLALLYEVQENWDEAIVYNQKAITLQPMEAGKHARLGLVYAYKRDRDRAMLALKEAQRFADPEGIYNLNVVQTIGQAYHQLGEIPLAAKHYEEFVVQARKEGVNPDMVNWFEETAQRLKATLTPTFVDAKMPDIHTKQTLQRALQEKLTGVELEMVVNPVEDNPEMRRFARQLTQGAGSESAKAKAIFDGLTRRIQRGGQSGTRTAQEVFALWSDPNESFNCQEYAKLYLALAREVGVKTFYVHLGRDYRGKLVFHDCAIVFVGDKALLVDPAYRWFGVPHKEFVVLDDVQTIAHHFFQPAPTDQRVSRCRLAAKLHPDFAWGQLHLASALLGAGRRDQAQKALEVATRLEPGRWDTCRLQGRMACHDEDWESAVTHLHKALELNPEDAESHFLLATSLAGLDRQEAAREAYRACLRHGPRDMVADWARRAIVQINEAMGSEPGQEYETAALMVASEAGRTDTVRRLLAEGADVNAQETSGATPLMVAALCGHTDVVRLLLEHGADVNVEDPDGVTALMMLAQQGHTEIVELLLEAKADVNVARKTDGITPLIVASGTGNHEGVKLLLAAGADVHAASTDGFTPLYVASQDGHVEVAKLLLAAQADVNAASTHGFTPLYVASGEGHTEIVKLLLQNNADVGKKSTEGVTALWAATQGGHSDIVELLLASGADVNTQLNTEGSTALMMAAQKGHIDIVKLLLEGKADVSIQKKSDGATAFVLAGLCGQTEAVRLLLESGVEVNTRSPHGPTALMVASDMGHTETVRLLIQSGADVTVEARGRTALSAARSKGHAEIVDLLIPALQSQFDSWVSEGMPIPQDELRAYYDQVKDGRFVQEGKVQLRLIHIMPSELEPSQIVSGEETPEEAAIRIAAELSDRIRRGEDFSGLAKTHSRGPMRLRGGLWPALKNPNNMTPPYNIPGRRAWNMQVGQVSKPIQIDGDVFILKVENRVAKKVQSFDQVEDALIEELQASKRTRLEKAIRQQ